MGARGVGSVTSTVNRRNKKENSNHKYQVEKHYPELVCACHISRVCAYGVHFKSFQVQHTASIKGWILFQNNAFKTNMLKFS